VAIYHRVYEHEGFEKTAETLFDLVQRAEQQCPGRKRCLYLDVDGHRNSQGGFDSDIMEIQTKFLPQVLSRHLSEFWTLLGHWSNPKPQDNDIPPSLVIRDE
jgi:hypothetical protein